MGVSTLKDKTRMLFIHHEGVFFYHLMVDTVYTLSPMIWLCLHGCCTMHEQVCNKWYKCVLDQQGYSEMNIHCITQQGQPVHENNY